MRRTSGFYRLPTGEVIYPWTPEERADLSLRARIFRHRAGLNPKAAAELAVKERLADGCSLENMRLTRAHQLSRINLPVYLKE